MSATSARNLFDACSRAGGQARPGQRSSRCGQGELRLPQSPQRAIRLLTTGAYSRAFFPLRNRRPEEAVQVCFHDDLAPADCQDSNRRSAGPGCCTQCAFVNPQSRGGLAQVDGLASRIAHDPDRVHLHSLHLLGQLRRALHSELPWRTARTIHEVPTSVNCNIKLHTLSRDEFLAHIIMCLVCFRSPPGVIETRTTAYTGQVCIRSGAPKPVLRGQGPGASPAVQQIWVTGLAAASAVTPAPRRRPAAPWRVAHSQALTGVAHSIWFNPARRVSCAGRRAWYTCRTLVERC